MEATRWPIDVDALRKGDVIPAETLERLAGHTRDSARYQLAVLKIKERIDHHLFERGRHWTLCIQQGEIKVLTDAEAATYNHAEQVRARRAQLRRHALQSAVDVTQLSSDQRQQHDRNLIVDGRYAQAIGEVQRQIAAVPHARIVPTLSAPEVKQP